MKVANNGPWEEWRIWPNHMALQNYWELLFFALNFLGEIDASSLGAVFAWSPFAGTEPH